MRSIATVGLKDCTDRKYVRCCTVLYEDVLRRTKRPTKLQPSSGHWANDSQNLNMSCRCCIHDARPVHTFGLASVGQYL